MIKGKKITKIKSYHRRAPKRITHGKVFRIKKKKKYSVEKCLANTHTEDI